MIQRLKCFFGFHNWIIEKQYWDLLGFCFLYPANVTKRKCLNCMKKEESVRWH